MKARIAITLKQGVLDPQGKAIHTALSNYGFDGVKDVRQGKIIDMVLDAVSVDQATQDIQVMCQKLLANMVIEDYEILSIA
ncbi:MAG: phosphoribosylformylglycinamidine synthase [Alphaproteobacteria bacterium]|jgi:phosphoribosylformylglycinamidine synthase